MTRRLLFIISTLLLILQLGFNVYAYSGQFKNYRTFTDIDGLPRNIITCISQDSYGYIWVGTGSGMARYDGIEFVTYRQFNGMGIISLFIDKQNNLWVSTNSGLYFYNRLTNYFELNAEGHVLNIQADKNGDLFFLKETGLELLDTSGSKLIIKGKRLINFAITEEGIWISESNEGAKLYSRKSGYFETIAHILDGISVSVIAQIDGNTFFGCRNGQLYVKELNGAFRMIPINNHHLYKKITKIGNEIWLATDGNGVIILDSALNYSRALNRTSNQPSALLTNSIYDIWQGANNEIWLASYGAGLTCLIPDYALFKNITPEKGNKNSLIANEGVAVYEKDGRMLFGTNYGMSVWDEEQNTFTHLSSEKLRKELKGIKVLAINADEKNNYWVGTYDGLLGKYDENFNLIKAYNPSSNDANEMQLIAFLHNYNNTNMIIGTNYLDHCLLNFNLKDETVKRFELLYGQTLITQFQIGSIRENKAGELIALVSNKGLYKINVKENVLKNVFPNDLDLSRIWIRDFYQDNDGSYWIITGYQGIVKISKNGKIEGTWTENNGLPTNSLLRVESTDDRFLWISTIAGICRFDMLKSEVLNFNYRDGIASNEFRERTSIITSDNRIIFGSFAGFTIVDPQKLMIDSTEAKVVISDITFQNNSIRNYDDKRYLTQPLEDTPEITLPFKKNSFTIHFFTRNKEFPKHNNYTYRLTGLEKEWIFLGETNHTTYTNLSPGKYIFEVKSINSSYGEQNNLTQLTIFIKPPWFRRWFAYFGYLFIFISTIGLILYVYVNRIFLKKEVEMSAYEMKKERELTEKKLSFFTNISHDLKTPLTLIDAPVNDLLQSDNLNSSQINKLIIIQRNSKRLYKLITDLLDFRNLTKNQIALNVKKTYVNVLIEDIYQAFSEECKNKLIDFERSINITHELYVDAKKIEKILWNLLSNAVKFTEQDDEIFLSAEEIYINDAVFLRLIVKDTGIGILEQDKHKIFDRFYQSDVNGVYEGAGIGLSIVKDLVEMHNGEIRVDSSISVGTTFTVTLPAQKDLFSNEEIANPDNDATNEHSSVPFIDNELITNSQKQYNLPCLLLVEDNSELREYLVEHFEKSYKVLQAGDGLEGLKIARDKNPDLILSDVLMPNMNGYRFCREIRSDFETSHIPVVLLTANSAIEHQIEGLETGADAYITKPFDIKLLDTTILAILENRKKLRYKFLGVDNTVDKEDNLPQKDMDFIKKLRSFIEESMINPNLNIDFLSEHFAISRSQLNRKIKSLTGTTPTLLIRTIRLKKAYELIKNNGVRVSEAAYQTGFSDPNYFTICFKKEFGENPSQIS